MATETKRQSLKKVDGEKMANGIYFATFNGGTEFSADVRKILPDFDGLPEMGKRVVAYGLKQKLDDSMAGAETETEAIEEVQSTWEAIEKGQWTIRVAGEGIEGGLFARAYHERHNITLGDAKAKIAALVEKNRNANNAGKPEKDHVTDRQVFNRLRDVALERDPELKAKYEALKAKKAAKQKERGSSISVDLA